jgi:dynein heavy chain
MRAVRSVINAGGLLKQQNQEMDEEQLLLRALRDVNVPKFLKDDLPLFENIINDLFPGVEKPQYSYGELVDSLVQQCQVMNLQPIKPFMDKVLQLYDTIQVRHGLMLVGPTGGGKTSNYTVLQKAMTALDKKGGFTKVHTHILNPKSITMGQLYGQFNEQTHEWADGVLAYIVRETVKDQSGEKHWVMFDGPVDALWIESMNTVLDDNKKLCLNSGQILTLTPWMTMMFEVEDLAVASPATVSRCGMVYMEPEALGFQLLIDSWILRLPENITGKSKNFLTKLRKLMAHFVQPMLTVVRKSVKEVVSTSNNNLVSSLMRIMDCYLVPYTDTETKKVTLDELEQLEAGLEQLLYFSLIWSLGATGDYESREKFNAALVELIK